MVSYDFSKCLIDFSLCPQGTRLIDFFTELSAFEEFTKCSDNEIKIAICTSDMDSPFLKVADRESMLKSLFSFLGISNDIKDNKKLFEDVLYYKHFKISSAKARYIQMQHVTDWAEWLTVNETFSFLIFESNRPKEDNETNEKYITRRVRIKDDIKKTGRDLKEIEAKLFPDSKSAREIALNEAKRIKTYPEMYAQERRVI